MMPFAVRAAYIKETDSNLGACPAMAEAADRAERTEGGLSRVVTTYRLCSSPRSETVSWRLSVRFWTDRVVTPRMGTIFSFSAAYLRISRPKRLDPNSRGDRYGHVQTGLIQSLCKALAAIAKALPPGRLTPGNCARAPTVATSGSWEKESRAAAPRLKQALLNDNVIQAAKLWHQPNDCAARIGSFAAITSVVLVGKPIYRVVTRRLASSAVSDPVGLVPMSCWNRRIDARASGPKIPSTGP